jgi:SAM-dependent methyltransferase
VPVKATLRNALPGWMLRLARPVYHVLYRAGLAVQCWFLDLSAAPGVPPAMLRFRVCETTDLSVFLAVGEKTAQHLEESLAGVGVSLRDFGQVLDFGCGAGRTSRWLTARFPEVHFSGCDVDAEAIAWCQRNLLDADYRTNRPVPPTSFAAASFDLVYAISVLTHLSLEYQKLWLAELHRLLKADGLLLFTVHGEIASHSLPPDKREKLQREGFLFETSTKLRGIVPEGYHTAYHSEPGVRRILGDSFHLLAYNAGGMGYHDVVIAQAAT